MNEKEFEEEKSRLIQLFLADKTKAFEDGKKVAFANIHSRNIEHFRHNNIKHLSLVVCYLLGHKMDILTQFCSRCNISSERLMNKLRSFNNEESNH